jgi:hypothetical protein
MCVCVRVCECMYVCMYVCKKERSFCTDDTIKINFDVIIVYLQVVNKNTRTTEHIYKKCQIINREYECKLQENEEPENLFIRGSYFNIT